MNGLNIMFSFCVWTKSYVPTVSSCIMSPTACKARHETKTQKRTERINNFSKHDNFKKVVKESSSYQLRDEVKFCHKSTIKNTHNQHKKQKQQQLQLKQFSHRQRFVSQTHDTLKTRSHEHTTTLIWLNSRLLLLQSWLPARRRCHHHKSSCVTQRVIQRFDITTLLIDWFQFNVF